MARTLADCLAELARGGEINQAEYARLRQDFEARRDQHRLALGDDAAAAKAAAEMEADLTREAIEKRRRAALTVAAQDGLKTRLTEFRRGDGAADINEAALREIGRIEMRMHAIEGMARAGIADMLDFMRKTKFSGNIRNRAVMDDVIRAWHGDPGTSGEAVAFKDALDSVFEGLRQRLNAAGADIPKASHYGGPHWHDPAALRAAGFAQWREAILPRLDPARTGEAMIGRAMSADELDAALPRIYEKIVTEGWNLREPMLRPQAGSLAGRRAEPRSLQFKSGDDWLAYNRDFGAGDPFDAVMREIHLRARDLAAMEILGPNPAGMVHWLTQTIEQQGAFAAAGRPSLARAKGEAAIGKAAHAAWRIEAMVENITAASTAPVSNTAANILGTWRSVNTAAKLGAAIISSAGDLVTQRFARNFNAIGGGSVVADVLSHLASYRFSKDEARRAGLTIDSALTVFQEQARYAKGWNIRGTADFLADRVLTWSGLTPYTHAGRHVFGFSVFGEVADQADKSFAELPEHFRRMFERGHIGAKEWDVIRAAPVHRFGGAGPGMIRPTDIVKILDGEALPGVQRRLGLTERDAAENAAASQRALTEIATRYLETVWAETEYAVPTGTARARTIVLGKTQPGTVAGEALRSATQFRAYPLTFGLLWGQRIADELVRDGAGRSWSAALSGRGAAYATGLAVSLTLLGALSVQLKNMARGRDPENMNPATAEGRKFWGAAIAQGGGLGIFSDFIFTDHNRYGNSLAATLAGPLVGDIEDTLKLFGGTVQRLSDEKETTFGKQLLRVVKNHVPGGNLWYVDLAAQRLLWNNLERLADPKAEAAFARQQRTRMRERGQEFWWAPGENAPRRAPDPAAAIRGR